MKNKVIVGVFSGLVVLMLALLLPNAINGIRYIGEVPVNTAENTSQDGTGVEEICEENKTISIDGLWNQYIDYVKEQSEMLFGTTNQSGSPEEQTDTESKPEGMTVRVLDVGQGLSVLVQADGETLLYDGGKEPDKVLGYLDEFGVKQLDYVICSHYDADHCGGLVGVLEEFPVGLVLEPDTTHDSATYEALMEAERGITVTYPAVGDTYTLGAGSFTIISPVSYDYSDSNNLSVGIRIAYGDTAVFITGDAELESELDLIEYADTQGIPLTSNLLVAGHHGSNTSNSSMLLDAVKPSMAAISVGKDNTYGHPGEDTLNRLRERQIEVYRTDEQGTLTFYSDGNAFKEIF